MISCPIQEGREEEEEGTAGQVEGGGVTDVPRVGRQFECRLDCCPRDARDGVLRAAEFLHGGEREGTNHTVYCATRRCGKESHFT